MARPQHTPPLASLEEAVTVLFCLVDDAYTHLNPKAKDYESTKRLSDSEVLALALLQQLRGVESERSFLRDAGRFFSGLFPGVVGLAPSSLNRRVRRLRRFLEPPRRAVVAELAGNPETLIVDSTLLAVLHPRRVNQSVGWGSLSAEAQWAKWGSFAVYGMKLHLICSTNRVPVPYELTAADAADVLLVPELLADASLGEDGLVRKLLGDSAYRSAELGEESAGSGAVPATEKADRRPPIRRQVEVCFAALKGVFCMEQSLAKTLVGLVTRIAAKVTAYTHGM